MKYIATSMKYCPAPLEYFTAHMNRFSIIKG